MALEEDFLTFIDKKDADATIRRREDEGWTVTSRSDSGDIIMVQMVRGTKPVPSSTNTGAFDLAKPAPVQNTRSKDGVKSVVKDIVVKSTTAAGTAVLTTVLKKALSAFLK